MGFFSRFFSSQHSEENSANPDIQFGRYTDRNKTKEQLESWTKCIDLFKEKKYIESYNEFFKYLKDPKVDNVKYEQKGQSIEFEFVQGSKIVKGYANEEEVFAEAEVVAFEQPNVAVMRKLLSENYFLWFSKFCIRDNFFTIRHRAPALDSHPSSIYFSFKELSNVADSFDDVLIDEFPFLKAVNTSHIQEIPEEEKNIKLKYMRKWISETLKRVEELEQDNFSGARAFLLLTLTYKLYYLLAPEGTLLDEIRFIQSIFFKQDNSTDVERNYLMVEEYKKVLEKDDAEILKSLYKVKATFAVVKPTHHTKVLDFIKDEIQKINWYKENKYYDIQLAICEYIVAYSYFNFGLEPVIANIFHVFWHSLNFEYFNELGFKNKFYDIENNKFNPTEIQTEIEKIIIQAKTNYRNLNFNIKSLNFNTKEDFATSFLYEFLNCNFAV